MTDDSIKQKAASAEKKPEKRAPRIPKKISDRYLHNVALYYLQRYASTSQNLRAFLMRRVQKSSRHHETDTDQAKAWIDQIIIDFERSGLLNDKVYAESKVGSLRRRGDSKRSITMKLQQKGLASDQIADQLSQEDEEAEEKAAYRFVERRRLGPHRIRQKEGDQEKDLASLARAGFSYDIAKRVLSED